MKKIIQKRINFKITKVRKQKNFEFIISDMPRGQWRENIKEIEKDDLGRRTSN